jgi:hypothetical protein
MQSSAKSALLVAKYLDIQGFRNGRLNIAPRYLVKYNLFQISYAIGPSLIEREEFRTAYFRALRMAKDVKPDALRRQISERSRLLKESGLGFRYMRRIKKADRSPDVPQMSQTQTAPA